MVRRIIAWLRERIAVEDAEERIEGTGEAITSPQHRRTQEARRLLERQDEHPERRHEEP
ncbi:hypothetical protein [Natrinema marinum]|uniref:hypothetical protein n=1 Tax=Natrinema marinum TaxID=2961598 RepID=UPI0020C869B5|nr:hypothetical protein [Natrinema marinum]